jgi:hypothetical protein
MCQKLGPPRVKQKNEGEKERFNLKSMEQAAPSLCNAMRPRQTDQGVANKKYQVKLK